MRHKIQALALAAVATVMIVCLLVFAANEKPTVWRVTFYENGVPTKTIRTTAKFDSGFIGDAVVDIDSGHCFSLVGEYSVGRE
jgi:hypothetical protein